MLHKKNASKKGTEKAQGKYPFALFNVLFGNTENQSAKNLGKECHRFWLRLRHTVILISNV